MAMTVVSKEMSSYNSSLKNLTTLFSYNSQNEDHETDEQLFQTAMYYSNIISSTILGSFFAIFGVVSNVINMVVFLKIGFKDSINMSLFALAVSDFGSCMLMFPVIFGLSPFSSDYDWPVNWTEFAHITGAWPHLTCTKISTLITAFITFERCLCVFMPLKVKLIITRNRTVYFLIFSYVLVLGAMAPLFYSNQLGWTFNEEQNQTILGLVYPPEREDIERIMLPFINAFISLFAFIFIIISTVVLVVTLNKQSKWRLKTASAIQIDSKNSDTDKNNKQSITTKEQSISRMVVMISLLFLGSLFPSVVMLLVLWIDRRFDHGGAYFNLFVLMMMINFTFETVNASMNIVIYYKNSTNYKAMFDQIFGLTKELKNEKK